MTMNISIYHSTDIPPRRSSLNHLCHRRISSAPTSRALKCTSVAVSHRINTPVEGNHYTQLQSVNMYTNGNQT